MRVCIIGDDPHHPLLVALADRLGIRHRVEVIDPEVIGPELIGPEVIAGVADRGSVAQVYLLKGHSPRAIALARSVEQLGARVVNEPAATELCQDRARMAEVARCSGLPFPHTSDFARLSGFLGYACSSSALRFPVVVKSRRSRRGDLVRRVESLAALRALSVGWSSEPVVVQESVAGDGWDHKVWVIGEEVFVGLRRSALDPRASRATLPLDPAELPPGWLDLIRDVGKLYELQVYGVDILATRRGPVIVDVNPFPGCRGVRGAPKALAAMVAGFDPGWGGIGPLRCAETPLEASHEASHEAGREGRGQSPVTALHTVVGELLRAVAGVAPLLKLRYLWRKPGRGVLACYRATLPGGPDGPLVAARVGEVALADPRWGELLSSVDAAELRGSWPGILRCDRVGLVLQAFPADHELPALPGALAPAAGGALAAALTAASRSLTAHPGARVVAIVTTPVRYQPGSRCVIRYRVQVAIRGASRELVLFGKLYRCVADAATAHRTAEQLWQADRALVSRPLGLVDELGLVLSEAVDGIQDRGPVSGTRMLRPSEGGASGPALAAAAALLARLHTCRVRDGLAVLAAGSRYAARVRGWAAALEGALPSLSGELSSRADAVAVALEHAAPVRRVPGHGAFAPSQLIFTAPDQPVVTDLDAVCLTDPALDVGYFLAHLRPARFWSGHQGARAWFTEARGCFLGGYLRAVVGDHTGLPGRAALFEAALLLKIASRRVRRLQSPRPGELATVLGEIDACLRRFASGKPAAP